MKGSPFFVAVLCDESSFSEAAGFYLRELCVFKKVAEAVNDLLQVNMLPNLHCIAGW